MLGTVGPLVTKSPVKPVDYEEVTVATAAIGLDATKVANVFATVVKFEAGPVRIRVDGTDPTATVGIPMYDGDYHVLNRQESKLLKMIRTGADSGKAYVTYYELKKE